MKIKLIMSSRLSYYFCGSVALSTVNTIDNPMEYELGALSRQEVIGLNKAIKTGVIKLVEGEAEFTKLVEEVVPNKAKKEVKQAEVAVEVIEEVVAPVAVEVKEEVVVEEEKVETPVEPVAEPSVEVEAEEASVEVKATPRRRTTRK